jgi:hypothetical protein
MIESIQEDDFQAPRGPGAEQGGAPVEPCGRAAPMENPGARLRNMANCGCFWKDFTGGSTGPLRFYSTLISLLARRIYAAISCIPAGDRYSHVLQGIAFLQQEIFFRFRSIFLGVEYPMPPEIFLLDLGPIQADSPPRGRFISAGVCSSNLVAERRGSGPSGVAFESFLPARAKPIGPKSNIVLPAFHVTLIALTKAVFADLSFMAIMIEIHRAVLKRGGELRFSGVDENTARMFSLSCLDRLFADVALPVTD